MSHSSWLGEIYRTRDELDLSEVSYRESDIEMRASEWLKALLKALYESGSSGEVEHTLEELCHIFDLNLPSKPLKFVPRKDSSSYTQSLFKLGVTLSQPFKENENE